MSWIEGIWWREREPAAARLALLPLSLAEGIFRAGVGIRGALYGAGWLPAARADAPVISVGNLAVGGSGKTPVALLVAPRLAERGRTVALLSRGWGALRGDALVMVTSAPGVLRDVHDPGSRVPRVDRAAFDKGIADGSISGGMIPKLEESFEVLKEGARSVVVVGRLGAGDLRRAVLEPGSVGTVLAA